jgi:hypothetical protein
MRQGQRVEVPRCVQPSLVVGIPSCVQHSRKFTPLRKGAVAMQTAHLCHCCSNSIAPDVTFHTSSSADRHAESARRYLEGYPGSTRRLLPACTLRTGHSGSDRSRTAHRNTLGMCLSGDARSARSDMSMGTVTNADGNKTQMAIQRRLYF